MSRGACSHLFRQLVFFLFLFPQYKLWSLLSLQSSVLRACIFFSFNTLSMMSRFREVSFFFTSSPLSMSSGFFVPQGPLILRACIFFSSYVCLFVCLERSPSRCIRHTLEGVGRGPLYEVPVSHSSSKVGIHPSL